MGKKRILLAVGDAGAWAYFMPICPQLAERYDLQIFADPKGAAINDTQKANVPYRATDGSDVDFVGVSAVLCGTAGKAFDLWRNATTTACSAGVTCFWFGDFYGSCCEPKVDDLSPDYAAIFDGSTHERFLKERPLFPKKCVRTIGNPSFDLIASLNIEKMRKESRSVLGLSAKETFVVYSASSMGQFKLEEEAFNNIVPWAKSRGAVLAVRFHPADVKNKPEEIAYLRARLVSELEGMHINTDLKGFELASAADLFVTDYSTEGVRACLAGVPTVFIMLESARQYQDSRGGVFPYFSILELDYGDAPALVAFDPLMVGNVLNRGLAPDAQRRMRKSLEEPRFQPLRDGKAGERVLQFVSEVVG